MSNLCKASTLHKEPLMYSPLPNHPWEKVGSDLFKLNHSTYLLVVDYFLPFVEIQKLSSINSRSVILALKAIFSRHEVPATLVSDNGPQSRNAGVCRILWIQARHQQSTLPQSNGMAERSVKVMNSYWRSPMTHTWLSSAT